MDIVGSTQTERKGLGWNSFKPFGTMSTAERREAVTKQVKRDEAESHEVHLIQCSVQGQCAKWDELVVQRKISWSEIWSWTTSRTSFLLRSVYDELPSLTNLVRWKVVSDNKCSCGKIATMKHTLSNCELALQRYEWRHNEVLKIIADVTNKQLEKINDGDKPRKEVVGERIHFVKEGQTSYCKRKNKTKCDEYWNGEWKMEVDLPGNNFVFPVVPTGKRPDIVVWCEERQIVRMVELTVPFEDNIDAAEVRKQERYEKLVEDCEETGWVTECRTIEVGCRGFVGNRTRKWLLDVGLGKREVSSIIKTLQETVEKASHWIWLKREDRSWKE